MKLRLAREEDFARLYSWRIDPQTRSNMRTTGDITLTEHMTWLAKTLSDRSVKLYVASSLPGYVGTARLDLMPGAKTAKTKERVECSVTVDPRHRGHGYGSAIVSALVGTFCESEWSTRELHAKIRTENLPSLCAFANAGFVLVNSAPDAEGFYTLTLGTR